MLFFAGVLKELGGGGLRVESLRGEVVPLVSQHAHELGGQRLIENEDDPVQVRAVRVGHRTPVHVLSSPLAQRLYVGQKLLHNVAPRLRRWLPYRFRMCPDRTPIHWSPLDQAR